MRHADALPSSRPSKIPIELPGTPPRFLTPDSFRNFDRGARLLVGQWVNFGLSYVFTRGVTCVPCSQIIFSHCWKRWTTRSKESSKRVWLDASDGVQYQINEILLDTNHKSQIAYRRRVQNVLDVLQQAQLRPGSWIVLPMQRNQRCLSYSVDVGSSAYLCIFQWSL